MEGEVRKLNGGGKEKVLFVFFLYRLWWQFVYAKTFESLCYDVLLPLLQHYCRKSSLHMYS